MPVMTATAAASARMVRITDALVAEVTHCGNHLGRKPLHRSEHVAMRNAPARIEPADQLVDSRAAINLLDPCDALLGRAENPHAVDDHLPGDARDALPGLLQVGVRTFVLGPISPMRLLPDGMEVMHHGRLKLRAAVRDARGG